MSGVSAVLIVKNEEAFLARALESLCWCDEIVVVDAMSTDRTAEIAKNPKAPWIKKLRWIQQPWLGFSNQRNFAMAQAHYDWIFFLDGDEQCSPELAARVQSVVNESTLGKRTLCQYQVRRQEFFLGQPIHHGIWNPSRPLRLFPKAGTRFHGEVHEGVGSPYSTQLIEEPIIHVEDLRIERFLNKLNTYTTLQAQADFDRGLRTHWLRILLAFPAMVLKNWIYYRGYQDGEYGFIISLLEGLSRTVRHLKIWQLQQLEHRRNRS